MSSMSMMTAAAPQAAPRYGAMGQVSEAAGGMDQLFVQIMQQLQALLDQTQGSADGSMLPQDGEALPPELLNDLVGFAEHLQGELAPADQEQLAALVPRLVEDGVPQEQVRQLAQTALLLQDAQRQGRDQNQPEKPAATLLELVRKIRTAPQEHIDQAPVTVDSHSVDELLLLAEKLRNRSPAGSAVAPATEIAADDLQAVVDPVTASAPSASLEQAPVAPRRAVEADNQTAAADGLAEPAPADPESTAAPQVSASAQAGTVQSLAPSSRAEQLGSSGRSPANHDAQPAGSVRAGSGAESVAEAGSGGADSRQEGRRDDLREQGLARWVELRDTVFAQGQKLQQSEAAFKGMLGSQPVAERGEAVSLSAANPSASLMQLQQAYLAPGANATLPGFGQRFGSQAWAPAASERISMMAGQNISTAELRLDPPELGSLRIRLTIQGDQTSLSFVSPHAHVREVLEQQMPRLREMLAESGLQLGQADVSDQSQSQSTRDDRRTGAGAGSDELDANNQQDGGLPSLQQSLALVDYYA